MRYGWGIDFGVGSLGFAIIELDKNGYPASLVDGISLIYPSPTGAVDRRLHKSSRTQNQRRSGRMGQLRHFLKHEFKLSDDFDVTLPDLPDGEKPDGSPRKNNSRVRLRAHGLSDQLSPSDLARAILHIAKNRGQRLTRGLKDTQSDKETNKTKAENERKKAAAAANKTAEDLATLGEKLGYDGPAYPAQLLMDLAGGDGTTRLKKHRLDGPVFTRAMVQREFKALLNRQDKFHRDVLTDAIKSSLVDHVFHEADPKAPAVGKCRYGEKTLDGEIESRLPRGSDLFQCKRIYEEVNNIRILSTADGTETLLSKKQRDILVGHLLGGKDLSAAQARKLLKLRTSEPAEKTNLDQKKKGRKTAQTLAAHPIAKAMLKAKVLAEWQAATSQEREAIAELVRTEDEVDILQRCLKSFGLGAAAIHALTDTKLPSTYSAAGPSASAKILAALEENVISNHEAENRAGLTDAQAEGRSLERLPYYGETLPLSCVGGTGNPEDTNEVRFGRIPNPVVHVALNQIRKLANAYLKLYGKPHRICVELARDMNKSAAAREEKEREAERNRKENEAYIEKLGLENRKLTQADYKKLRLHRMQNGVCLYTGAQISTANLFDGSVEVDHILPRALTRDDSISNLALVTRAANQYKQKRTPFEAFSNGDAGQDYAQILARAWDRGKSVYWRFAEKAMERYRDQAKFADRFLNDTRYIGKVAMQYLKPICADPNGLVALNGRITSDLRYEWGLSSVIRRLMSQDGRLDHDDVRRPAEGQTAAERKAWQQKQKKIRFDHRHHLLDAIVAACTTRSDVHRLQTLAARLTKDQSSGELLAEVRRADPDFQQVGICWQAGFRDLVMAFLDAGGRGAGAPCQPIAAVVHKADHDPMGQLHDSTNYGVICAHPTKRGQYVTRDHVALESLYERKKIEDMGVPDTVIDAVKAAVRDGGEVWWGKPDPVAVLTNNLKPDLEQLKETLLNLIDTAPLDDNGKKLTEPARVKWAIKEYIRRTCRRRFTRVQIKSVRLLRGPVKPGARQLQANPTDNNDRLIYFVNGGGKRDCEVVSKLNANDHNFVELWRREGGRRLFTLRKNDTVEMARDQSDPSSERQLFRVVSFSQSGGSLDLEFLPIEEARGVKDVPETVRHRIRSLEAFNKRGPQLVVFDCTGRERWHSRGAN